MRVAAENEFASIRSPAWVWMGERLATRCVHFRSRRSKRTCTARGSPSSDYIGKKLSPPMTTAPSTTPAANGSGSTTATATTATVNNNNNHSNNNNNGSSIKQQQQQQQSSAGGQQLMSAAAAGCCPVCGTALRTAHELESHFIWELERLYKQAAAAGRRHRRGTPDKLGDGHHMHGLMVCPRDGGRLSPVAGGSSRDATLHGRWETYQKVKANRHNRLRIKNRKRKPDEMLLTPTPATCCCPVCSEPVAAATQEQMNAHVEMCLRNKGHPSVATAGNDDEDENVDVEGDAETTMYDIVYGGGSSGWHGQQPHNRLRQQQMLMHGGGYNRGAAAVAMNCTGPGNPAQQPPPRQSATGGEDSAGGAEDAVLVVDDNDNENGGSSGSLYNKLNDPSAMEAMDSCENVGPLDVSIKKENTQDEGTVKPKMDVDKYCAQFNNNGQVVEALKARIRELESVSKTGSDKFTCLLCKGNFKDPVVSTSCWHVYCEVCWLQILGAKKLCPQCYVITLPSNLRRVYL